MAVLKAGEIGGDLNYLFKQKPDCFLCGEPIKYTDSCIYWMGLDGSGCILFHKHCASSFAAHLLSDFTRMNIEASNDKH